MEPRSTSALLRGRAWGALLGLGVALVTVLGAFEAAAQNRNSASSFRQQYEAAIKAAQKEAQRRQQQQQKKAQAAQPKTAGRAQRDTKGEPRPGQRGDGADDDDADDIALSQAEQRVREIEDMRRNAVMKAQREQAAWRQEQQQRVRRAGAEREGAIRRLFPEMPVWARREAQQRPADDGWRAEVSAVAVSETVDQRRVRWLEGFQRQASHLGMGRAMRPAEPPARAEDPPADAAAAEPGLDVRGKIAAGRSAAAGPVETPFPGQERGAEMPAELYGRARGEELVVTGLSPVDLETAKLHGFVVSPPTLLGVGRQVTRLRAPGTSREEALRELHKVLPFLSATPNQAYTIYMGSLGETEVDPASGVRPVIERHKMTPATRGPCPRETCFGRELINWTRPLSACTRDVRIGVIDTSFDLTHPAFRHIRAEQAAFLDGRAPSPYDWHGTAVLSLLAGDPESGTPGLAPNATFLLATAFRSDAAGNASTDTVRLLSALAWLDARGVDVVNMSFTGPQDPAFERAIADMRRKGVVFVAAAGNMGPTAAPSYPAAYPDVIAVTAVNRNGEGYRHANRGTYIDASAPGVDILTALPGGQQGLRTGTSFAAPFVTAIAATRVGEPVPEEVALGGVASHLLRHVPVRDLGPPGPDPIYGAGLVMAPSACAPGRDTVARAAPALESWAAQTTLIRAGALAP